MSYKLFTSSDLGETVREHRASTLGAWRLRGTAALRIAFGAVWAIDAWFKWQPAFASHFTGYLMQARNHQPAVIVAWITFWLHVVVLNPPFFAHMVALGETYIALCLVLGAFSNLTCCAGIVLSFVIWSTAEGFGGPYGPGSTDIGVSIIYVLVFVGLFLGNAGRVFGLDMLLDKLLGRWCFLASASVTARATREKHHLTLPPYSSTASPTQGYVDYPLPSYTRETTPFTYQPRTAWHTFETTVTQDMPEEAARDRRISSSRLTAIKGQRLSRM